MASSGSSRTPVGSPTPSPTASASSNSPHRNNMAGSSEYPQRERELSQRRVSLPPPGSNYKGKNYNPNYKRGRNSTRHMMPSVQHRGSHNPPAPATLGPNPTPPRNMNQQQVRSAYEEEFPSPGEAAGVEGTSADSDGCHTLLGHSAEEPTYYRTKHVDDIDTLMSTSVPKVHHRSPDIQLGEELEDAEMEQERKLFVGGLSYNTDDQLLYDHFSQYGTLTDCIVMKDPRTKRSRGFGFVCFQRAVMLERCMEARPHYIDQRPVEPKRAVSRLESGRPGANKSVTKLHVKWCQEVNLKKADFHEFFSQYGGIEEIEMQRDPVTNKSLMYAYVIFKDYDTVDKAISSGKKAIHENSRNSVVLQNISETHPNNNNNSTQTRSADDVPRNLIIDKIEPDDVLHEHIICGVRCFVSKGFTAAELKEIKYTMEVKRELQQRSKAKYQQEKMAERAKSGYFKKQHSASSSTYSVESMHDSGTGSGENGPLQDRRRQNGHGPSNAHFMRHHTRNAPNNPGKRSYLLDKPTKVQLQRDSRRDGGWKGEADKENCHQGRPMSRRSLAREQRDKEQQRGGRQPEQNMGCYTQRAVETYMQGYHEHFQAAANQLIQDIQGTPNQQHQNPQQAPLTPPNGPPCMPFDTSPIQMPTTPEAAPTAAQYQPLDLTHLQKQGLLPTNSSAPLLPLPSEHQMAVQDQQFQENGDAYYQFLQGQAQNLEYANMVSQQFNEGMLPQPDAYGNYGFNPNVYHHWGVLPEGVQASPGLWLPPTMDNSMAPVSQEGLQNYVMQHSTDSTTFTGEIMPPIDGQPQQPHHILEVPTLGMANLENGMQHLQVDEVT